MIWPVDAVNRCWTLGNRRWRAIKEEVMMVEKGGNECCNSEFCQPGLMRFTCREGKRQEECVLFFYKHQGH